MAGPDPIDLPMTIMLCSSYPIVLVKNYNTYTAFFSISSQEEVPS